MPCNTESHGENKLKSLVQHGFQFFERKMNQFLTNC
jgi:hypothetical protein